MILANFMRTIAGLVIIQYFDRQTNVPAKIRVEYNIVGSA